VPEVYSFSVIGDSNIQRNLVDYNCGTREDMRSAQVVPCPSPPTPPPPPPPPPPASTPPPPPSLSNFIRDSESSADVSVRITSVLEAFRSVLFPYCSANADLSVMIAPPQFSRVPMWYSESLGLILQLIKSLITDVSTFSNLHVLPSFPNQVIFCYDLSFIL